VAGSHAYRGTVSKDCVDVTGPVSRAHAAAFVLMDLRAGSGAERAPRRNRAAGKASAICASFCDRDAPGVGPMGARCGPEVPSLLADRKAAPPAPPSSERPDRLVLGLRATSHDQVPRVTAHPNWCAHTPPDVTAPALVNSETSSLPFGGPVRFGAVRCLAMALTDPRSRCPCDRGRCDRSHVP